MTRPLTRTVSRLLLGCCLALTALVGSVAAEPSEQGPAVPQVQSVIQQFGDLVAGPDLSPYARDRKKGDIVGTPPPVTPPPVTPPPVTAPPPVTTPPPVSVAPPPAVPPVKVSGWAPIQELFDTGQLIPTWLGQGRVAGEMLELTLQNTTDRPIALDMEPGMVIELEDDTLAQEFQPVLLETDTTLLVPAGGTLTRVLRGYCLNYQLLPPEAGREFPYRFPADATAYMPAIKVLKASLTYDAAKNVMPVNQQRTIVIQRGIWAALGQTDKEKLLEDILKDAADAGKHISKKKAQRLADNIWNEVQRLLSQAQ